MLSRVGCVWRPVSPNLDGASRAFTPGRAGHVVARRLRLAPRLPEPRRGKQGIYTRKGQPCCRASAALVGRRLAPDSRVPFRSGLRADLAFATGTAHPSGRLAPFGTLRHRAGGRCARTETPLRKLRVVPVRPRPGAFACQPCAHPFATAARPPRLRSTARRPGDCATSLSMERPRRALRTVARLSVPRRAGAQATHKGA